MFWQLTFKEMLDLLKTKRRENAQQAYLQAQLITLFINNSMSKSHKSIPTFDEMFPDLLPDEIIEQNKDAEVKAYKAKWLSFMRVHNKRGGN